MARRVVSVVRGPLAAVRGADPVLEANAWALAEDVDLTLLLRAAGVELALAGSEVRPGALAGVALPPAAGGQDLRGLVESGIPVYVATADLDDLGLAVEALVAGVRAATDPEIAALLRQADAVLAW